MAVDDRLWECAEHIEEDLQLHPQEPGPFSTEPHLRYLMLLLERTADWCLTEPSLRRPLRFPSPPDSIALCEGQPCLPGLCSRGGNVVDTQQ